MYSEDDIAYLKFSIYLMEEKGLNVAGVKMAFDVKSKLNAVKNKLLKLDMNKQEKTKLSLDECVSSLGNISPESSGN
jgi:hypothetical protein